MISGRFEFDRFECLFFDIDFIHHKDTTNIHVELVITGKSALISLHSYSYGTLLYRVEGGLKLSVYAYHIS